MFFWKSNHINGAFCSITILLGRNIKNCGIKFCSPKPVRVNFGIFFVGSVSLTLEAFSRLIWVCLAN